MEIVTMREQQALFAVRAAEGNGDFDMRFTLDGQTLYRSVATVQDALDLFATAAASVDRVTVVWKERSERAWHADRTTLALLVAQQLRDLADATADSIDDSDVAALRALFGPRT